MMRWIRIMYSEVKIRYFLKSIAAVLLSLCLAGCGGRMDTSVTADGSDMPDGSQMTASVQSDQESGAAFPGSYTVPEGWVKVEKYSTEDKFFYVEKGHEEDERPDNISIETGTNRYSADEHEQFRDAIVRQLMAQLQGVDAELTGDGTYTEQGYVIYIFTITEANVVTKQYYIVGDQQYCLIHLTCFTGSESADQAARTMADSFIWD